MHHTHPQIVLSLKRLKQHVHKLKLVHPKVRFFPVEAELLHNQVVSKLNVYVGFYRSIYWFVFVLSDECINSVC